MILNKILSWNKLSILGISLMLLNNISCIDYEDNVNPNEVTEEMMEVDNLKTGAFFSQMLRRVVIINDGDKPTLTIRLLRTYRMTFIRAILPLP